MTRLSSKQEAAIKRLDEIDAEEDRQAALDVGEMPDLELSEDLCWHFKAAAMYRALGQTRDMPRRPPHSRPGGGTSGNPEWRPREYDEVDDYDADYRLLRRLGLSAEDAAEAAVERILREARKIGLTGDEEVQLRNGVEKLWKRRKGGGPSGNERRKRLRARQAEGKK